MCGINGFNWADKKLLSDMNGLLKHRGPDNEGIYIDKKISLGHRRLAILDLSEKGNQPMVYTAKDKKKAIIVFNGQIYNFLELKKELSGKGYKFNSKSDTEVILASYLEWGFDCVKKFNGMWSFAIYDPQKSILFLSRDRLGQKPLYYFFDGKKFIFSSELKSILCHNIRKEIDDEAVDLFLSLAFIPSPKSILKNVYKLEPRQNMIFNLRDLKILKYYYYKIPKYKPVFDKKYLIKKTKSLLFDATKKRMISDVPFGAFLSGGLDSSFIVYNMAKLTPIEKLNTFSIGFSGKYDETSYIKTIIKKFKTKHHHIYFKEEDFEKLLKEIVYLYDEPFADSSVFPTLSISKLAKKYVSVSLSGDGADELFAGYPKHLFFYRIWRLQRLLPESIKKVLLKISNKISNDKVTYILKLFSGRNYIDIYMQHFGLRESPVFADYLKNKYKEIYNLTGNMPETITRMDLYYLTVGDNYAHKLDSAGMGSSLEIRCPFMDYRFLELEAEIPINYKISFKREKEFIRQVLAGIFPRKIIIKRKQGFKPPLTEYLRKERNRKQMNKKIEKFINSNLLNKSQKEFFDYINRNIKKNNLSEKILRDYWKFAVLACWADQWLKK